jgi:hypothetical protein
MVTVLEMPVTTVEVVDVVVVGNLLAVVILGVRHRVIRVDLGLRMTFPVVDVVDVITMHDGLVPVSREVFVVAGFGVLTGCHRCSWALKTFTDTQDQCLRAIAFTPAHVRPEHDP